MISKKKITYPPTVELQDYLQRYGRISTIPVIYEDMCHFHEAIPYENPDGDETLWRTVLYTPQDLQELKPKL